MKNTNEIIEKIKSRYLLFRHFRDFWLVQASAERELGRKKNEKQSMEMYQEYQNRLTELAELFSFITGLDWCDSIRELLKD